LAIKNIEISTRKKPCSGVPIDEMTTFAAIDIPQNIFSENWHTAKNSNKNVLLIRAGVLYEFLLRCENFRDIVFTSVQVYAKDVITARQFP
jgi:hypothetical protein